MRRFSPIAAAAVVAAVGQVANAGAAAPGAAVDRIAAEVRPGVAYFDAPRRVTLRYRVDAGEPVDLRIQVVQRDTGEVVRGWLDRDVAPREMRTQRWSGIGSDDVAADGPYKFVLRVKGAARAAAVAKFHFHDHVFPVAGPHSYREGEGEFGAPRPGRVHEGKDVWAGCGEEVIAARGGRVQRVGYHEALYGNFAVIDGRGTRMDYFYVHLLRTAAPREGDRVRTGALIGYVGASGNAESVGCMLHLEMWPDGFRQGDPIDPEPFLRAWDGWS